MSDLFAVIMAGGRGERFWPMSTQRRPKQFLSLVSDRPMLVESVERLNGLVPLENILVQTNARHEDLVRRLLPQLPPDNVIGEPVGRDTAPAVALATGIIARRSEDAVYCMLTADHVIGKLDVFRRTLKAAAQLAAQHEVLITIGVKPTEPSTGYGYIEAGESFSETDGICFFRARRFVEKPDRATAEQYLKSGNFFWNSGMFVWRVAVITEALRKYSPQLYEYSRRVADTSRLNEVLTEGVYGSLEKISIDYAVMEKADNVVTARAEFDWDDIGSWSALASHLSRDSGGNAVFGRTFCLDSASNVVASDGRLVALLGVKDLIVVQSGGVVLVCPRDRAQEVKKLVQRLEKEGGYEDVL